MVRQIKIAMAKYYGSSFTNLISSEKSRTERPTLDLKTISGLFRQACSAACELPSDV